ncbi:CMRF35-like molecule 6 [Amia ocellicauda]|uniref:CMRF35-like molecule 6 n=1 Tax=Amia ocellicauda TaxID=2972642 RepID=UPI003463E965
MRLLRLLLLLLVCLIPGHPCHTLALRAGETVSVRCHCRPWCRQGVKAWCRQTSENECAVVAATTDGPKMGGGRTHVADDAGGHFITLTLRDLQESDSGAYYCGVRVYGRFYLLGRLEIKVSAGNVTADPVSTPRMVTLRKPPVLKAAVSTAEPSPVPSAEDRALFVFLACLLAVVMLVAVVTFVRVVMNAVQDHNIERRKLPLVMARLTRRKAKDNVYGGLPQRTQVTLYRAQPRSIPAPPSSRAIRSDNTRHPRHGPAARTLHTGGRQGGRQGTSTMPPLLYRDSSQL